MVDKKKPRKPISDRLRQDILLEAGFQCAMFRCNHEVGIEIHHIDGDRSNSDPKNLLALCAVHHRMATNGSLKKQTCIKIKSIIAPTKVEDIYGGTNNLQSRRHYVECAMSLLEQTGDNYRATVVGPLMLHPDWYFDRRDEKVQIPNYEKIVFQHMCKFGSHRFNSIRFIFRNSDRYKEKVDTYVKKGERAKFIDDVCSNINVLFGTNGEIGPDVCCVDTGFFLVEIIFKDGVLQSRRRSSRTPIDGGVIIYDKDIILQERSRFDTAFDSCSQGRMHELNSLINFVQSIW